MVKLKKSTRHKIYKEALEAFIAPDRKGIDDLGLPYYKVNFIKFYGLCSAIDSTETYKDISKKLYLARKNTGIEIPMKVVAGLSVIADEWWEGTLRVYHDMSPFPEIHKHMPKSEDFADLYWFTRDDKGVKKRIAILEEAIELTKRG